MPAADRVGVPAGAGGAADADRAAPGSGPAAWAARRLEAEAAWAGRATAGPGDDCDAQIVPVVTGRIDSGVLDRLTAALLHGTPPWPAQDGPAAPAAFGAAAPDRPGDGAQTATQTRPPAASP